MPTEWNSRRLCLRLLKELFSYYRTQFILVLVLIIMSALSGVLGSLALQVLLDRYLLPMVGKDPVDQKPVIMMLVVLAAIYLAGLLCSYGYQRLMVKITRGTTRNIRVKLFAHMERLPISYLDGHPCGDIISIFTNDTDTLRQLLSQSIPQLISAAVTILSALAAMLWLNWYLCLITITITAICFITVWVLTKKNRIYFSKQQQQLGELSGYLQEMLEGQKTIRLYSREEKTVKDFEQLNDKLKRTVIKTGDYSNALYPLMTSFSYLAYIITAVAGMVMMNRDGAVLTLGVLAAFLQLGRIFIQPVSQISQQINYVITAVASAGRIFSFLDQQPEEDEGQIRLLQNEQRQWEWQIPVSGGRIEHSICQGNLTFTAVRFGYQETTDILKALSFSVRPGETIAFVGATGAGKTTILNLINRFYDADSGAIQLDDIDLKQVRKSDLRKAIGIVTQTTYLFNGTIGENIAYGNPTMHEQAIVRAAQKAQADSFIRKLPEGYQTILTNNGENLSAGERQLIAIARVIAADPQILLLDEATASIDTRTERLIQQGIKNMMTGRTIFIIAHRLETVREADQIIVLKQGVIAESGTHHQLLEHNGEYKRLYSQCRI